jgi:glycyl-tRNA synthetase
MAQALNFQQAILKLHQFWADQGCAIWEPYNVQVGAGTGNPATLLRVLGPEPWRVAYVEPSVRPDDGRFGDNPNRMQKYYQYQVILKPDPGNPQEMYLKSLEALGINPREHDIRFVEDNWESPALGAWGLGWEVWLDGQEITQFTYFQQAGGMELDPVAVEITYGLERIVLAMQEKKSAWEIDWTSGLTYKEMMFNEEIEHCRYYFDIADVDALKRVYETYEHEVGRALEGDATISAYDYVLKCSHLFNVLDTRGAIGVTERAKYFRSMRDMTRSVAQAYAAKRAELGHPLLEMNRVWGSPLPVYQAELPTAPQSAADVLFEIGIEELPAHDVDDVLLQLRSLVPQMFTDLRLSVGRLHIFATPRRVVIHAEQVAARQPDDQQVVKGPPARAAFDKDGKPTKAAEGFARGKGLDVSALRVEEIDGGEYVVATVHTAGRAATHVLQEALPKLLSSIRFGKAMRWNSNGIAFSRPIRWMVALFGEIMIPFEYAGTIAGNITRGLRPYGSPEFTVSSVGEYLSVMAQQNIFLNREERREIVIDQITGLAEKVGGTIPNDPGLLDEVTNLVEAPMAFVGRFEEKYLALPRDVLVTVMRKHQRYFPVVDASNNLMPYFIAVRNGDMEHLDKVTHGNEQVLKARFSDADYFYNQDIRRPLESYLQRLDTLVFHEKLGSMLQKNNRIAALIADIATLLGYDKTVIAVAEEAAGICKADLATQMVVEMTSLQGAMGREYALREGRSKDVAVAIFEHWLPRGAGDILPETDAGIVLALVDKLDSLTGLFAAGLAPKSTSDPFGLRRAALGVVQIVIARQLDVDLSRLVKRVAAAQPAHLDEKVYEQLMEFIRGRLDGWLEEEIGAPRDVINAVLAEQAHNPYRAYQGILQLREWTQKANWSNTLDNFARCVRISRGETARHQVNPALLQEPSEQELYAACTRIQSELQQGANVDGFLQAFEAIVPTVMTFFEQVMVNAEDEKIRHNRLGLMQAISNLQSNRADLSELIGF